MCLDVGCCVAERVEGLKTCSHNSPRLQVLTRVRTCRLASWTDQPLLVQLNAVARESVFHLEPISSRISYRLFDGEGPWEHSTGFFGSSPTISSTAKTIPLKYSRISWHQHPCFKCLLTPSVNRLSQTAPDPVSGWPGVRQRLGSIALLQPREYFFPPWLFFPTKSQRSQKGSKVKYTIDKHFHLHPPSEMNIFRTATLKFDLIQCPQPYI
jgi:hypothetical protein